MESQDILEVKDQLKDPRCSRHAGCLDVRQQHENLVWRSTVYPKQETPSSAFNHHPYEAMFGTEQRFGLGDSPHAEDMYSSIETEEELEQLFNPYPANVENMVSS